jgi:uncharacterized protein YegP (UPF0339 family)
MIKAHITKSKKGTFKIKLRYSNGEPFNHDYNRKADAVHGAALLNKGVLVVDDTKAKKKKGGKSK